MNKSESQNVQQTGGKTENHKMINGIVLRVDVTRKISREEENTNTISDDTNNNAEEEVSI